MHRLLGGRGAITPKTLFDKARSDARRKAVIYAPTSKINVAAPPANAALLVQAPTRAINVTTTIKPVAPTVKMTQVAISPPSVIGVKRPLPEGLPSPVSKPPLDCINKGPGNRRNPLPASKSVYYPSNPNPIKRPRGGADALFMPKHAILPIPNRAR